MMKKMIPLAFGLLWLSGCAQPVSTVTETRSLSPAACCTTLEQLPAQSFNGKSSRTLIFDAQTPRIALANGSARAQLLALPAYNGAYTIELTTPLNEKHFLATEAVIYDAQWQPLQKLAYADFEYRKPALLESHRLFARMQVQPGINAPRWLVISTVAHPQPDRLKRVAESEIYAEKTQVEAPLEQAKYTTASEDGTIHVRIGRFSQLANELIDVVTGR
ncbi:MAG: MalM family protein [Kluyvera sp.]|uniref:MalM family protein n=1 Tax=Kluyvera sp. TaxID=1538228 RepID=UPI003A84971B